MPCICYTPKRFNANSRELIDHANTIIAEYTVQGYSLTLRQLFYQFVSRAIIPNTMKSYKALGSVINDARLAGLIDWDSVEDRTRNLHTLPHWSSPSAIVSACAEQFRIDMWRKQPVRIECWIEKEALAGVFERICDELRVPFFACRGYTSQSEMWSAGQRLKRIARGGQTPMVMHFGDHDPSGIDMTRDIIDRLELFIDDTLRLERLALNMDQVDTYAPPPNPAKLTDTRADAYITAYGNESWELDALNPNILADLVRDFVTAHRDEDLWNEAMAEEAEHRRLLQAVSDRWGEITDGLLP